MSSQNLAAITAAAAEHKRSAVPKKRGNYNCGRCGLPKKGHVCPGSAGPVAAAVPGQRLNRRALSFEEDRASSAGADEEEPSAVVLMSPMPWEIGSGGDDEGEEEEYGEVASEVDVGGEAALPVSCMIEVLSRLSPKELMGAEAVCRGWRDCGLIVWRSAEELRLRVTPRSHIGYIGSVLQRCRSLVRLTLTMQSVFNATMLACIAFSCPKLEAFEISISNHGVNRITGDELSRFVSEKRCLSALKMDGCSNLGQLHLTSSSISTIWLSDLYCVSKSVIKCPNLKEISLEFFRKENDTTDLVAMLESVGHNCQRLKNVHVSSIHLCNDSILALESADLRDLCMLSLLLGSRITDAAVTAIVTNYFSLEFLDLSGSSISDSGIRMICNAFPDTLTRLRFAACPNITSIGIQLAAAQLPHLVLLDCGMSIGDIRSPPECSEKEMFCNSEKTFGYTCQNLAARKQNSYQKLIIKHGCLRKLSLWGCLGLESLYLSCPELNDLNLNSCINLHPERLLLQCPNLKNVHASGCQDMLIGAIRNQVLNGFATIGSHLLTKRSADGSKRVGVPHFLQQSTEYEKPPKRMRLTPCEVHHDS